ncbi:MAG: HD domain-containing protein [Actinomycetota bacterium]|nr:HD domain-containing protein [Actinomycetota bacterium]
MGRRRRAETKPSVSSSAAPAGRRSPGHSICSASRRRSRCKPSTRPGRRRKRRPAAGGQLPTFALPGSCRGCPRGVEDRGQGEVDAQTTERQDRGRLSDERRLRPPANLAPVFPRRLRDHSLDDHAAEVAELATKVGGGAGLSSAALVELELAARLHDVGKDAVPPRILSKPAPLTEAEWAIMRRHPEWGSAMLADIPGLEDVASAVRAHHEHWDGNGYPQGLAGADIPFASRIVAVCDAFSAMTTERPYRGALPVAEALAELRGARPRSSIRPWSRRS